MKPDHRDELLQTLRTRFEQNMHRHSGIEWTDVEHRLQNNRSALKALRAMEASGGEPDVVNQDERTGYVLFSDCSRQSPSGRRSVCYDREARQARKKHKPESSAEEMASAMGIDLLTEEEYRQLQQLDEFDTTTSSWIMTPPDMRSLGGALFCDRRYGHVFTYHNGAESYYAARGFRGCLRG
jgi:hypothetical protein